MGKVIIAVDLDEVLGYFVEALNQFVIETTTISLTIADYKSYEFFEVWNMKQEEAQRIVEDFLESKYFREGLKVVKKSFETLSKFHIYFEYHLVTSRQYSIKNITCTWLSLHFPG